MAKFGDYVAYDGLIYRIVAVSEDAEPTYTLEPMRKSETELKKTVEPTNPGYLLTHWSLDVAGEEPFNFATDIIEEDTILYAQWAEAVTVTFESNGGTVVDAQIIVKGGKATAPDNPTKEHYTFDAWYHDATFTNAVSFAVDEFEDSATLYAKWTPVSYTATFEAGEGLTDPDAQTITYGNLVTVPVAPSNPGYLLTHWSLDVAGEEPFNFATDIIEEDTILYAQWAEAVTVTFNSNGGTAVAAQIIVEGGKATAPDNPTKEHYTFAGWFYDDGTFETAVDFSTDVFNADDTLYAKWDTED